MNLTNLGWLCAFGLLAVQAQASTLFYNGTPNGAGVSNNILDCGNCRSAAGVRIYENFTVGSGGWQVTGLFGNYFSQALAPIYPTTAVWEIRQGISSGNGGTLVAGGTSSLTILQLATPPNGLSFWNYYKASTDLPSLTLTAGSYWMALSPNTGVNDESYLVGTDGAGGTNALIDGTSFANGTYFTWQNVGSYLQPFNGRSNYDFSYGVTGNSAVPEPASWMLLAVGIAAISGFRKNARMKG